MAVRHNVGEVVPAREGLRLPFGELNRKGGHRRRGCSSKRRIKTCCNFVFPGYPLVGEVVPAREGLRLFNFIRTFLKNVSERLFQQEKD